MVILLVYHTGMNNLLSYYGLIDTRMKASDKDLLVKTEFSKFVWLLVRSYMWSAQEVAYLSESDTIKRHCVQVSIICTCNFLYLDVDMIIL